MLQGLGKISRLKGFFRSGLNYKSKSYEQMLNAAEKKSSGSLPSDILSKLLANNADKKEAIQGTEKVFNDAVDILGDINKLEKQSINRMSMTSEAANKRESILSKTGDFKKIFNMDRLYSEKETETIIKAEEKIIKDLKQYIPETENVVITPLGCGQFGNGYKLSILDKNGKQIFNDKVLKVYRDNCLLKSLFIKNKRFMDLQTDEQILANYNKTRERIKQSSGFDIGESTADEIRSIMNKQLENITKSEKELFAVHGPMAEANTSEYLRYYSGHKVKPEDGIAIPSYFGLGNTKFSLGEFIGKDMKADKKFDFERLALKHGDFECNPGNGVNGICIDMGGITQKTKDFPSKPVTGKKYIKEMKSSQSGATNEKKSFPKFKIAKELKFSKWKIEKFNKKF